MKKLLITGGTGMLGSHLVRLAAESAETEIHATFHVAKPNFQKVFWHYADARSGVREWIKKIEPTHIIHTMAISQPDVCEQDKMEAWRVNVGVTKEIAEYASRAGARLIYTSTDMVFDGERGNYEETDETNPVNFYGDTKLEGEQIVKEMVKDIVIARLSLLYGYNLNGGTSFFSMLADAIKKNEPIKLFRDQIRTMLSLDNAARCLLELVDHKYEGLLHIGGATAMDRYTFGKLAAKHFGTNSEMLESIVMKDARLMAKRPRDVSLNIFRAKKILTTKLLTAEEGLNQLYKS